MLLLLIRQTGKGAPEKAALVDLFERAFVALTAPSGCKYGHQAAKMSVEFRELNYPAESGCWLAEPEGFEPSIGLYNPITV